MRRALRTLRRNPASTTVIVATLAVAIAATTVVVSVLDELWRLAFPMRDSDRIVFVASTDPRPSEARSGMLGSLALTGTSLPDLIDWSRESSTIEEFSAFSFASPTLSGLDVPLSVSQVRMTANLPAMWGIAPIVGRSFVAAEGKPGAAPVAIVSQGFFERQLGGQQNAIGRPLTLDGTPHTVIGVWAASTMTGVFRGVDVVTAEPLDPAAPRDDRRRFITARLKPGVSRDQAGAELEAIGKRLQIAYPVTNAHTGVVARPLVEMLGGEGPFIMAALALAALLIVIVACANVCNILLAQACGRARELAVRAALGAGRWDHLRQWSVEGLLLSGVATIVGLLLAAAGIAAIQRFAGSENVFSEISLNGNVLAISVSVALLLPFGFALLPAVRSLHSDVLTLRNGERGAASRSRHPLLGGLVALQVGLAMIVTVQAGFLTQFAWDWQTAPRGFDPARVLTFDLAAPSRPSADRAGRVRFLDNIVERVAAVPGSSSAAAVGGLPLVGRSRSARIRIDGAEPVAPEKLQTTALSSVTRDYFATMRVQMLRGRALDASDFGPALPAAVITREAACRFWPDQDPVGRRFALVSADVPETMLTVVGVAADARSPLIDRRVGPQVYVPASWWASPDVSIVMRTSVADPTTIVPAVRAAVARVDPTLPVARPASMDTRLREDGAGMFTFVGLVTTISLIALCLAVAGIYAVVSYHVTQRRREIGVRMAVGARPATVVLLMMRAGMAPLAVGGAVGLVVAVAVARAMAAALGELDTADPAGYAAVIGILAVVALAASYVPARRATHVDPVVVLRGE